MKILAVETATEACSAALYLDGEIIERYQVAPREHTRLILPMLDSLLAEASITIQDLDALAFGRGPGSFTGVRIATGVIHGIAIGSDLPVVPVSTLAAIAQDCFERTAHQTAFVAMDARMGEVYWGVYRRNEEGLAELEGEERVCLARDVEPAGLQGFGVGSGWGIYRDDLMQRLQSAVEGFDENYLPRSSAVARLGAFGFQNGLAVPVENALPVYLRDQVARKPGG